MDHRSRDSRNERRRDGGDRTDSLELELRDALYGQGADRPGLFEQMRRLQTELTQHATAGMHTDTARRFGELEGAVADVRKWAALYQEDRDHKKRMAEQNAGDLRKIAVGVILDVCKAAVGLLLALVTAKLGGLF